jgi:hypothetical protein
MSNSLQPFTGPLLNPAGAVNASNGQRVPREGTMKTLSKNWVPDAIGIVAAAAGLALLVAVVASADPIGLGVGAMIGGGFAFGVLGCGLKQAAARRADKRRATPREASAVSDAPVSATIVAIPRFADATASEFDDVEHRSFAPVMSLTEAQAERQRAKRRREKDRAALTRA